MTIHSASASVDFSVDVARSHSYGVSFEPGLTRRYGERLRRKFGELRIFVLTDTRVRRLHADGLVGSLESAGYRPKMLVVPEGERSKSIDTFARLQRELVSSGCDRHGLIVCLGGGMISDLGGYVASAYMRGIRYANFATSLLAQVDACVGGKVAVNLPAGKNLVGAFHHPVDVAGDPECLSTLSDQDFRSGMAEAIKVAILDSPVFFDFLDAERDAVVARSTAHLTHVVGTATRLKMARISEDPYEDDLRRPLNFGHTLGHPIETEFAYRGMRHGEAVAIGMGVATCIALDQGIIARDAAERIFRLLARYGLLGYSDPIRPDSVIEHMRVVRLIRGKRLHFVLPTHIGGVHITEDVGDREIVLGFERYQSVVAQHRS